MYKQADGHKINDTEMGYISNATAEGRVSFRIGEFAKKHNLGDLVAGNFYQAEFDLYVPILHAQLGQIKKNWWFRNYSNKSVTRLRNCPAIKGVSKINTAFILSVHQGTCNATLTDHEILYWNK